LLLQDLEVPVVFGNEAFDADLGRHDEVGEDLGEVFVLGELPEVSQL